MVTPNLGTPNAAPEFRPRGPCLLTTGQSPGRPCRLCFRDSSPSVPTHDARARRPSLLGPTCPQPGDTARPGDLARRESGRMGALPDRRSRPSDLGRELVPLVPRDARDDRRGRPSSSRRSTPGRRTFGVRVWSAEPPFVPSRSQPARGHPVLRAARSSSVPGSSCSRGAPSELASRSRLPGRCAHRKDDPVCTRSSGSSSSWVSSHPRSSLLLIAIAEAMGRCECAPRLDTPLVVLLVGRVRGSPP